MVVRKGTWKLSNSSCLIWSCGVLATKIRNTLTALQHLIRCADCEVFQHPELRNEKKSKTSTGSSCFFNADPETDSALKLYKKNCGTLWRVFLSKKKTKTNAQKQKTMEPADIYLQKFHKITIITNFLALFVELFFHFFTPGSRWNRIHRPVQTYLYNDTVVIQPYLLNSCVPGLTRTWPAFWLKPFSLASTPLAARFLI